MAGSIAFPLPMVMRKLTNGEVGYLVALPYIKGVTGTYYAPPKGAQDLDWQWCKLHTSTK